MTVSIKRSKQYSNPPSKKRKLTTPKVTIKGKQRAYERATISIPQNKDEDSISDEDADFFKEHQEARGFLENLDSEGLARSKKETLRLHHLSKLPRTQRDVDSLPSIDSHDEDGGTWSDNTDMTLEDNSDDILNNPDIDSEEEQPYEQIPRPATSWSQPTNSIPRLPIKLSDGRVMKTGERSVKEDEGDDDSLVQELSHKPSSKKTKHVEDVATRFGQSSIATVISTASRKLRIQLAKEQIASISQGILGDPESSLVLLRRLHAFSLPNVTIPECGRAVRNDSLIRRLAIMSQLAVFKDIIPGYRIRSLTEVETAEKVGRIVARTREWEQGLVSVYQTYLRALETEIKGKTEFADVCLNSMCTLLKEATHFNFRTNIISVIVMVLSKKSWNESSELCLQTLSSVFKADSTGVPSLEIIRMVNRMIKERKFEVHPNVLSCLSHLRLRSELGGVRASETHATKEGSSHKQDPRSKVDRKRAKGKKLEMPYFSKNARKALKEKKEIEAQLQEAQAEVDHEERANIHTETLKLLFVLYFRVLKVPHWTPLLPAALEGITKYAHMVNIDFFKDLMQVLRDLINISHFEREHEFLSNTDVVDSLNARHKLLCVITAFELLSGQGEALNIDLRDFITSLYGLIPSLASLPHIEKDDQEVHRSASKRSISDLLFRALTLALPVQTAATRSPIRSAAFAKRIATACLFLPTATTLRCLEFLENLLVSEPRLQALLSADDRSMNGLYRPELDDPELSNPFASSLWELSHLAIYHSDDKIKAKSKELTMLDTS